MRRVFLDANILVAVLNKEFPLFPLAARVLSFAEKPGYQLYTSPVCLAIAFYFASKRCGEFRARQKIKALLSHLAVSVTNQQVVNTAIAIEGMTDLEDAIEYCSALEAGCQYLVTEDTGDFYFATGIKVLCAGDALVAFSEDPKNR